MKKGIQRKGKIHISNIGQSVTDSQGGVIWMIQSSLQYRYSLDSVDGGVSYNKLVISRSVRECYLIMENSNGSNKDNI